MKQKHFSAEQIVAVLKQTELAIDIDFRLRGEHVVATLDRLVSQRARPQDLFADNGGKFTG